MIENSSFILLTNDYPGQSLYFWEIASSNFDKFTLYFEDHKSKTKELIKKVKNMWSFGLI